MRARSRVTTALLSVALAGASASTAGAAPPAESSTEGRYVMCEGPGAGGHLTLVVGEDDVEGIGGSLSLAETAGEPPLLHADETDGSLVPDGEDWTGSFVMRDRDGNPTATATFTVDVVPGAPVTTTERAQDGNLRRVWTQTSQPLGGSATVALAGHDDVTLPCAGEHHLVHERWTRPDATVGGVEIINVACLVPLGDGGYVDVWVEGGEHTYAFVAVESGESSLVGETDQATVTASGVRASIPVAGASGPLGNADLDVTMESTGAVRFVQLSSTTREKFRIEDLAGTGTLSLPDGRTIALDCDGESTVTHLVETTPTGSRPTGPVPGNDTRPGALTLEVGDRHSLQTRAAAVDAEERLWCYTNEPEPGMLPGHTVWYRFTGTGGELTVDSAGSQFNTMLAVYRVDDGALTEIACADDPYREGWQAYATVDTVAGAEYLVQIGGFGHQSGLLKIALR